MTGHRNNHPLVRHRRLTSICHQLTAKLTSHIHSGRVRSRRSRVSWDDGFALKVLSSAISARSEGRVDQLLSVLNHLQTLGPRSVHKGASSELATDVGVLQKESQFGSRVSPIASATNEGFTPVLELQLPASVLVESGGVAPQVDLFDWGCKSVWLKPGGLER